MNSFVNQQFEINTKDYRKNGSLIMFLSIFGSFWLIGTVLAFRRVSIDFTYTGLFLSFICCIIMLFTFFILFNINEKITILVENGSIVVKSSMVPWIKRTIKKNDFLALLLENAGAGPSLMIVCRKGNKTEPFAIAPFVGLNDKIHLQNELSIFLGKHNFEFEVVNKIRPNH